MTFGDLKAVFKTTIQDELGTSFQSSDESAEIARYLDEAGNIVAEHTKCLPGVKSWPAVAKKQWYDLPADFIEYKSVHYLDYPCDFMSLDEYGRYHPTDTWKAYDAVGDADRFMIDEADNTPKLGLWKIPSAAAATTTLNGAVLITDTSITLTSLTGFPTNGRIEIDPPDIREVVSYEGTSTLDVVNVRRGLEATAAAAHNSALTVNLLDIRLDYYRYPLAIDSSDDTATPEIPERYHRRALVWVAAALYFGDRGEDQTEMRFFQKAGLPAPTLETFRIRQQRRRTRRVGRMAYGGI